MRKFVLAPLLAMTSLTGAPVVSPLSAQPLVAQAESRQRDLLLAPRVDRVVTRATLLYRGMPAAEAEQIMGAAAEIQASNDSDGNVRLLTYPYEPIPTKVTISEGKVSGVALDVAGVNERILPGYSQSAWLGMHRIAVLYSLGAPAEDRRYDSFGMRPEHMVFERPGQPDVSIFLVDERVAGKKVGRGLPPDIFAFALPMTSDPTNEETHARGVASDRKPVRIGMTVHDAEALFGTPRLSVPSSFKSRPVEYSLFATSRDGSFVCLTFIDGALVEFSDGGRIPLSQILGGE